MREVFRLSPHIEDVMRDKHRRVDLNVIRLGLTFVGIHIEGHTLESVIDKARQLVR